MKKTVSVITPVFNGEPLLAQTVASIRNQKVQKDLFLEHILVSDDLKDYTHYQASEPGYRCIVLSTGKKGAGPSFARNVGVTASTGDYLSFLDADDLWMPDRVSTLLPFVDQYGAACDKISFIDMSNNSIYGGDTVIKRSGALSLEDAISIDGAYFPIYQRSYLKHPWDEGLGFSEDFLYNFLAISETTGLYVCPDPLMAYRIRPGSISHTMPESGFKVDKAYQYLLSDCPFLTFMSEDHRRLFLDRVKAKKELNALYVRAWGEDPSLTFESFISDYEYAALAS